MVDPKSILDKIGLFTATPALCLLVILIMLTFGEQVSGEYHFSKGGYRFKEIPYVDWNGGKRIEYYRTRDTISEADDNWVKDSTWIYLSETGDTVKKVKYKDGKQLK